MGSNVYQQCSGFSARHRWPEKATRLRRAASLIEIETLKKRIPNPTEESKFCGSAVRCLTRVSYKRRLQPVRLTLHLRTAF